MKAHTIRRFTILTSLSCGRSLLILAVACLALTPARADLYVWDGGAATTNWSDAANWSNATAGVNDQLPPFDGTDDLQFGPKAVGTAALVLNADRSCGSLRVFLDSACTISGNTLTLYSGRITRDPTGAPTTHNLNSALVLGNPSGAPGSYTAYWTNSNTTGGLKFSGALNEQAGQSWSLMKDGAGGVECTSDGINHSGGTRIKAGTLTWSATAINAAARFGTGTITLDGGKLQLQNNVSNARTVTNGLAVASAGGTITANATGAGPTWTLNQGITGSGPLTLQEAVNGANGSLLKLTGNNTSFAGPVTITGDYAAGDQARAVVFTGATSLFGSGPSNITVNAAGPAGFEYAPSAADMSRFIFKPASALILRLAGGAMTNIVDPSYLLAGGANVMFDSYSAVSQNRWPDAAPLPLVNAAVHLLGRNDSTSILEDVGTLRVAGGCRLLLQRAGVSSKVTLQADAMDRTNNTTVMMVAYNDATFNTSERIKLDSVIGIVDPVTTPSGAATSVKPWFVLSQANSANGGVGNYATPDANGYLVPATALYTNAFDATVTNEIVNLVASVVLSDDEAAYALRLGHAVTNTIPSDKTLALNGGGVLFNGGGTGTNTVLAGPGTLAFGDRDGAVYAYSAGGVMQLTAPISGTAGFSKFGPGTVILGGNNSALSGLVSINQGRLTVTSSTQIPETCPLFIGRGASLFLNANISLRFPSLTGSGSIIQEATGGGSTIEITNNTDIAFGGSFSFSAPGSRKIFVRKSGTGRFVYTGLHSVEDAITILDGTFVFNGTKTGSGSTTVTNNATLAGSGTMAGTVNVQNGGTLSPGDNGVGTLTLSGGLVLGAASALAIDLGDIAASDRVTVAGALTLDGTLTVTPLSGFGAGTYTIMTYGGVLTNNTLDVVWPEGYTGTVVAGSGTVKLQIESPRGTVLFLR